MPNPIGPLLPADEQFTHQIVDTFATVGSTDLSWTEKVCAMAAARDGSLQLGFGLGKYTNRDVMDCYAGLSRGVEQLTVRASRRLTPEPELTVVGPIHYEVHDALRTVRFALDANECQIRDTVIRVVDPVGGGEGWGNCQPIITGDHPDLGLSGDTSFM